MTYSEEEFYQTYQDLKQSTNPEGAFFGALIGAIPATAFYALIINFGLLPYFLILALLLVPTLMIALAARFSGKIYLPKHRLMVVGIACLVHTFSINYFHFITEAYYVIPVIAVMAFMVAKMPLNKKQSIVVDMEAEGRFENT